MSLLLMIAGCERDGGRAVSHREQAGWEKHAASRRTLLLFGSVAAGRTAAPARRIAKDRGSARAHLNIADVEVLALADLLQEDRVLHGRSAYLR